MVDPEFRCSSGAVPVFPLPGVVLFPKTVLPLHVFEPRYRAMVKDSVQGEGLIAISLLLPGWESNYGGSPPFEDIGTVGRIEELETLASGRFNLRLVGLQRVSFGQILRSRPYRVARIRVLAETSVDESDSGILRAKLDLLASHACLLSELVPEGGHGVVLDEHVPFETAVNAACANLPVDPRLRQSLLEENDLAERQRRAAAVLNEVLERVLRLKAMRLRAQGGGDIH